MFVARYPEWVATVVYANGHSHHFDGAKDLFKYLLDLGRWAPGHRAADMTGIVVTDYYAVQRIDARSAWYVIGSDVLGPMGHELVPLASEADARAWFAVGWAAASQPAAQAQAAAALQRMARRASRPLPWRRQRRSKD